MSRRVSGSRSHLVILTLLAGALGTIARGAAAQTVVENSLETRLQLDLQISAAALAPLVPAGWMLNVAAQGPAKDANLRAVFIDRVTINAPDGKPIGKGSNRFVYLVAPVKDAAGEPAQLVIGGLTEDPSDAPGPFGVYLQAATHTVQRSSSAGTGAVVDTQDWTFAAASGEKLALHIKYERGTAGRNGPTDTRFYSAKTPATSQISRQVQTLEILRNVTTNPPDKVKEFSFTGSGGSYEKLLDGAKVLSWDNFVWVERQVLMP